MAAIIKTQISINYDEIYDTLLSGGSVWLHFAEYDGYEMILMWYVDSSGLNVTTYNGEYVFPNGSYNSTGGR